ncbi:MAG: hypothetical protein QM811_21815 [Pirellulales bacterium]
MTRKLFPISGLGIVFLVALRVAMGWHFFNEGRDHYFDNKWSSAPFLKVAVGPLAPAQGDAGRELRLGRNREPTVHR